MTYHDLAIMRARAKDLASWFSFYRPNTGLGHLMTLCHGIFLRGETEARIELVIESYKQ